MRRARVLLCGLWFIARTCNPHLLACCEPASDYRKFCYLIRLPAPATNDAKFRATVAPNGQMVRRDGNCTDQHLHDCGLRLASRNTRRRRGMDLAVGAASLGRRGRVAWAICDRQRRETGRRYACLSMGAGRARDAPVGGRIRAPGGLLCISQVRREDRIGRAIYVRQNRSSARAAQPSTPAHAAFATSASPTRAPAFLGPRVSGEGALELELAVQRADLRIGIVAGQVRTGQVCNSHRPSLVRTVAQ